MLILVICNGKKLNISEYKSKSRKRKGIHTKTKSSKVKSSINYLKKDIEDKEDKLCLYLNQQADKVKVNF